MTNGRSGKLVASWSLEWNSSMVSVEFWGVGRGGAGGENTLLQPGERRAETEGWPGPGSPRPHPTHHEPQHQRAHALPDLRGDVTAELLQGGQEALEFAELPRPAGRGQLLRGQRGGTRGGWAIAEAAGRGWGAADDRGRGAAAVHHCAGRGGLKTRQGGRAPRTPFTDAQTGAPAGWEHRRDPGVARAQRPLGFALGRAVRPSTPGDTTAARCLADTHLLRTGRGASPQPGSAGPPSSSTGRSLIPPKG